MNHQTLSPVHFTCCRGDWERKPPNIYIYFTHTQQLNLVISVICIVDAIIKFWLKRFLLLLLTIVLYSSLAFKCKCLCQHTANTNAGLATSMILDGNINNMEQPDKLKCRDLFWMYYVEIFLGIFFWSYSFICTEQKEVF